MSEANKDEVKRYWDERDAKVELIRRLWTYRSEWIAVNGGPESIGVDDIGVALGASSVEAEEMCELGLLPAERSEGGSWSVPGKAFAQWLEDFGPEWFQARTERAVSDIRADLTRREEWNREAREELLNAVDALRTPEERKERSDFLASTILMGPPPNGGPIPAPEPLSCTPREALEQPKKPEGE